MHNAYLIIKSAEAYCDVERYDLFQPITIIGRNKSCHLVITSPKVSNYHFSIIKWFDKYILKDGIPTPATGRPYTKSNKGTIVNNKIVLTNIVLNSGDLISLPDGISIQFIIDNTNKESNYLSTLNCDESSE